MLKIASIVVAVGLLAASGAAGAAAAAPPEVTGFGSNPGKLRMFKYVPAGLPAGAPLVVALHGCTQSAADYDDETGWVKFAESAHFALLLPQQEKANNPLRCFNWFAPAQSTRDQGEALSIKQMIDRMKSEHAIDAKRVYITGLSAGGAMTVVMLAVYPEVFAGGASLAGVPYRCADDAASALVCMHAGRDLTPGEWGERVRAAAQYGGPWPRLSIWQGLQDKTVAPVNAAELVDQWTNVHGIDQTPDQQETVGGHAHRVFKDGKGNTRVETWLINGMSHGTPITPGSGAKQCGNVVPFVIDAGICSSYYIAKFWGLIRD